MRAYGSKRTFGNCRTSRPKAGGRIVVREFVKTRKHGRRWQIRSTSLD